jgi:hypothetical protein
VQNIQNKTSTQFVQTICAVLRKKLLTLSVEREHTQTELDGSHKTKSKQSESQTVKTDGKAARAESRVNRTVQSEEILRL